MPACGGTTGWAIRSPRLSPLEGTPVHQGRTAESGVGVHQGFTVVEARSGRGTRGPFGGPRACATALAMANGTWRTKRFAVGPKRKRCP